MDNLKHPDDISSGDIENFLKRRLGDKEGETLMGYISREIETKVKYRVDLVQNELAVWRNQLKDTFASKEDALELKKKLVKRVSAVEGTIILWGFVFWITLLLAFYIINRFVL